MPDRQRHSRLSDTFAGRFAARSRNADASAAGGHRGAGLDDPEDLEGLEGLEDLESPEDSEDLGDPEKPGDPAEPGDSRDPGHPRGLTIFGGPGDPSDTQEPTAAGPATERQGVGGYRNLGDEHLAAWQLSAQRNHEPDGSDPAADTTLLGRIPMQPTSTEQDNPLSSPDIGLYSHSDLVDVDDVAAVAAAAAEDAAAAFTADTDSDTGSDTDPDAGIVTVTDPAPDPAADTNADTDTDTDANAATHAATAIADVQPPWSWQSAQALLGRHRRRFAMAAAGIVALAALLALPPVRAQLRDSFTQVPKPYTALYFTTPPQVDGTVLTVPVSLHAIDTGTDVYNIRVWTVDAQGRVDDTRTAGLKGDGQNLSTVVSLPVNPTAVYVWVSLGGSTETLHYKIAVA